jgi:hypothetical protein
MVDQPEQHIACGHTADELAELIGMLQRDPDSVVPTARPAAPGWPPARQPVHRYPDV